MFAGKSQALVLMTTTLENVMEFQSNPIKSSARCSGVDSSISWAPQELSQKSTHCGGLEAKGVVEKRGHTLRTWIRSVLSVALLGLPTAGLCEIVAVGSQIDAFSVGDQFGEELEVDASVRAILFVRDRVADEVVKRALVDEGSVQLQGAGAVFVSDMSEMPDLIRKHVAIPMLRKREYPMGVDQEGSLTRAFPSSEGQPTLLVLEDLRIVRIQQLASIESVRTALAELKSPGESAPAARLKRDD